jgi:hypothetical protein
MHQDFTVSIINISQTKQLISMTNLLQNVAPLISIQLHSITIIPRFGFTVSRDE